MGKEKEEILSGAFHISPLGKGGEGHVPEAVHANPEG